MKFSLIGFGLIVVIHSFSKYYVDAECCGDYRQVSYICPGTVCSTRMCKDGTKKLTPYCGYGPCNIFGCDCTGGCRNNSLGTWEEAFRIFREKYSM